MLCTAIIYNRRIYLLYPRQVIFEYFPFFIVFFQLDLACCEALLKDVQWRTFSVALSWYVIWYGKNPDKQ